MISTRLVMLGIAVLLTAASVTAHHAFAAEYDEDKVVILRGTITRVDWENPHVLIHMDVTGANGEIEEWRVECRPPNTLRRNGVPRESIQVGAQVTITGWQAKDGSLRASGGTVTLPDQSRLTLGDSKYAFTPRQPVGAAK